MRNFKIIIQLTFGIGILISGKTLFAYHHDDNKLKKIQTSFKKLCQDSQFSGSVLIAINGKIKFKNACGFANRSFLVKNKVNTKFNLGSVGKLFTIIAIAQLIEKDRLTLNMPVIDIIPSWLNMELGKYIKIENLLTHSSGLGNYMSDKRWQVGADLGLYNTTNDYYPLIRNQPLKFEPGKSQLYSNSGYLVLGKIIEKLSNQSYSKYINQNIFIPLHMTSSGIYSLDEVIENQAVGYYYTCKDEHCQWKNNYYQAPFIGTSAGGAYSTVEDLFKFSQALHLNKLLDEKLSKEILSTQNVHYGKNYIKDILIGKIEASETFSPYGFAGLWNKFGFGIWSKPYLVGHTGGTSGAAALLLTSPNNKYTIIILSNLSFGTTLLYQNIRHDLGFSKCIKDF